MGCRGSSARKLSTLAAEFGRDGQISADTRPQIKLGARLVREWRGHTHSVTVTRDGFTYAGKSYSSLTRVAQEITGAHWSGPRFFGLVKRFTESRPTTSSAVRERSRRRSKPDRHQLAVEGCLGEA